MSGLSFVDTNILLYAHDATGGVKRDQASALLSRLVRDDDGVLSPQVLMEFYVNATRKLDPPLSIEAASRIITVYAPWVIAPTDSEIVLRAIELVRRYSLSPWDAQILASALKSGCVLLYSEDMQHGLQIEDLTIRNPFL